MNRVITKKISTLDMLPMSWTILLLCILNNVLQVHIVYKTAIEIFDTFQIYKHFYFCMLEWSTVKPLNMCPSPPPPNKGKLLNKGQMTTT